MDATKVTNAKPKVGGSIYTAPAGTTLPTDAKTALAAAYTGLGYISEDGLTNSNSPESENVKAWGGDNVLNVQTDKPDSFSYKLIEGLNVEVLKEIYGAANVTGSLTDPDGIKVVANGDEPLEHILVVDMILKGGILKRIVIPRGKISELGDIVYVGEEPVGYEVTLAALPVTGGETHHEYILDPAATTVPAG